jgi:hypothetical protein
MDRDKFNIIGSEDKLQQAVTLFHAVVTDRFAKTDINIEVDYEQSDDFAEWCERNGVKCEML